MKRFEAKELREAVSHAAAGGQALHVHRVIASRALAPACFRRAVERGGMIAHLFDRARPRLEATARRLGVRVIKVERAGTGKQHIDLCGLPLSRALAECELPDIVGGG